MYPLAKSFLVVVFIKHHLKYEKRMLLTVQKYCNKSLGNSYILNKSVVYYWTNLFLISSKVITLRETTYLINKGTKTTYLIYKEKETTYLLNKGTETIYLINKKTETTYLFHKGTEITYLIHKGTETIYLINKETETT
jgi:hypothetical protein